MDRLVQDLNLLAESNIASLKERLDFIPGSSIILRYIASSYQHDPIRSFFELLLLLFAIRYFLASKYSYSKKNYVQLTDDEIDELVKEWQPEPLVKELNSQEKWDLDTIPVIQGSNGPVVSVNNKHDLLNFTSTDFFSINTNDEIKQKAVESIRYYGVGSCGPAGFYGNQDAHANCERNLAKFLGTEGCILYAQGLATVSSVIPCFLKRSDVIVADDKVNIGIQKGMLLSRASLYWYKHNDMEDLEKTLARANRAYRRGPLPRRFIITEGIFESTGNSPDLKKIIELKHKYKYRLLLDESVSLGVLGETGRGIVEEAGVSRDDVEITLGNLSFAFGSAGGFCAGKKVMVEHQRITSLSYTFSATMPPYLANTTSKVVEYFNDFEFRKNNQQALKKKSIELTNILKGNKNLQIISRFDVPTIIVQLTKANTQERLEQVCQYCMDHGVFVTRYRRLNEHEIMQSEPGIKLYINNQLSIAQVKESAKVISQAFDSV